MKMQLDHRSQNEQSCVILTWCLATLPLETFIMKPSIAKHILLYAAILTPIAVSAECIPRHPVSGTVSSGFGMRNHPIYKSARDHKGVDFRSPSGTPVYAGLEGKVTVSHHSESAGNMIYVNSKATNMYTRSFHASKLISKVGTNVSPNDVVMLVGSTGYSTGPHLHYEVIVNKVAVNPMNMFCSSPSSSAAAPSPPPPNSSSTTVAAHNAANPGNPLPAQVTGYVSPPMQTYPTMDSMSINEFLGSETSKRFLNKQWYDELIDPATALRKDPKNAGKEFPSSNMDPKVYMLREANIIMALDNLMASQRYTNRENIEARLAAFLSLDAENYSNKIMNMIRGTLVK